MGSVRSLIAAASLHPFPVLFWHLDAGAPGGWPRWEAVRIESNFTTSGELETELMLDLQRQIYIH
jgi:hypothetical protein